MSHLVVIDGLVGNTLSFTALSSEPLTCLSSFAEKTFELYKIRQYGYHPEYGATQYEIVLDWGESFTDPGPIKAGLGEPLEASALRLALHELIQQYEDVIEGKINWVRHEGRITRCSFKPKGEYQDPPIDLDWTDLTPETRVAV